ncbi:hypothetical protein ACFP9V_25270 [Deinococcus radiopugnans]|uniref:hypothetical protein n=1 Tax=Deinococcus radiopugnans TaxID=57497 RepID=UPI00360F70E7
MIDLSPGDALPLEPTVYLVDDDDAVRGALGFLLGTVGLNVRPFADGLALERALDAGGRPPSAACCWTSACRTSAACNCKCVFRNGAWTCR